MFSAGLPQRSHSEPTFVQSKISGNIAGTIRNKRETWLSQKFSTLTAADSEPMFPGETKLNTKN
jgi:hypothetical protein